MLFGLLKENANLYVAPLKRLAGEYGGDIKVEDYTFWVSVNIDSNSISAYIDYDWDTDRHMLHVYSRVDRDDQVNIPIEDCEVIYDL